MTAPSPAAGLPPVTHLLYLHGFRSSPQSKKAQQTAAWIGAHQPSITWWCPQLPPSPREAVSMLETGCAGWPKARTALIGSSLGGFYATVLAERWGVPAVLLNPAVNPARDLAQHIGELESWNGEDRFFFRPEFIDELRTLTPETISQASRYFAVIAKGDEVLDWREMQARYAGCPGLLLEGSDHALTEFDHPLACALGFLGLA